MDSKETQAEETIGHRRTRLCCVTPVPVQKSTGSDRVSPKGLVGWGPRRNEEGNEQTTEKGGSILSSHLSMKDDDIGWAPSVPLSTKSPLPFSNFLP